MPDIWISFGHNLAKAQNTTVRHTVRTQICQDIEGKEIRTAEPRVLVELILGDPKLLPHWLSPRRVLCSPLTVYMGALKCM